MAAIRTSRRKCGRGQRRPNSGCIRRGCSMRLSCDSEARTSQSQKCSRDAIWATRGSTAGLFRSRSDRETAGEISLACETR